MVNFQKSIETLLGSTAGFMLNISVRNLSRQRRNTILTILTIFVAMFSFLLSVSIVSSASISVSEYTYTSSGEGMVIHDYGHFFNQDDVDQLKTITSITSSIPRIRLMGRLSYNQLIIKNSSDILRSILFPFASNFTLENEISNLSHVLSVGELPQTEDDICISDDLANDLQLQIGDQVTIQTDFYNISGIIDASILYTFTDFTGNWILPEDVESGTHQPIPSANVAFMSFQSLWRLLPAINEGFITDNAYNEIQVSYESDTEHFELIQQLLPIKVGQTREITVIDGFERRKYSVDTQISVRGFTFMIFVLIIAGLIILNTLLGAISARMKDIEVWSSVGANPSHIKYNFMFESMIFGAIGGTLGYIGAILFSLTGIVLGFQTSITPEKYDFNWLFLTILIAVILSVLSAIYPSRKASTAVVPSLKRSWKPGLGEMLTQQYTFDEEEIPITLEPQDFDDYASYIQTRIDVPTFFKVKRKWPVQTQSIEGDRIKRSFKLDVAVFSAEGTYALISMWSIEEPNVQTMKVFAQVNPYSSFGESSGWAQSSTNFNKASFDVLNMIRQLSLKWRVEGRKFVIKRD
ncbi:hypothetical protein CEE45_08220 [Candidatus Heimdallarchaeota archaeon B3_Heim]|nr:MAG: hypothetical protein CEE45_08220 [Candidatus Heimdallarchaeota archaeon B3_Heim]